MNQTQIQASVDKQIGKHINNIMVHLQSADKSLNLIAAAGIANPHEQSPMMHDAPYFITGISKTYTAAITMNLYEEGRLDLDAPIAYYRRRKASPAHGCIDGALLWHGAQSFQRGDLVARL